LFLAVTRFPLVDLLCPNYLRADFVYQKDMYDVVQVSDVACNDSAAVLRYSKGTNFVFELNRTGSFYFICSRGYCWSGMKVSVLVLPASSAQPPVTPPPHDASRAFSSPARAEAGVWLAALAALLASSPLRV
jgi:hypothetical protein